MSQIQAQIDRLLAEQSIPDPVWEVLLETHSPFLASISTTTPPKIFKMPTIPLYDGKTDPVARVQTYRTWMNIVKVDALTLCNAFPLTLSGPAQAWFGWLRAGTITNFKQLNKQFIAQFLSSRPQNCGSNYFKTIHQKGEESMTEYLERFDEAV